MVTLVRGQAQKCGTELHNTQKNEANLLVNNEATANLSSQISKLSTAFDDMIPTILATAYKAGTPIGTVSAEGPSATTLGSSGGGTSG